jgi:hypothetical protein
MKPATARRIVGLEVSSIYRGIQASSLIFGFEDKFGGVCKRSALRGLARRAMLVLVLPCTNQCFNVSRLDQPQEALALP